MTAPMRFAVIGAGVMGGFHSRVIAQSERCELTWVIDPQEAIGAQVAQRYGAKWRPEVGALHDVDAVVVAAPTEYHTDIVTQVLEAGLPVLVEKPVSADLPATEQLLSLAEKRQIPIMCGFVERFNPAVLTALTMVNEPLHITAARHSPYANRIRTGVTWDLLIHDIDACLRFANDVPVNVRSGVGHFHPASGEGGGEDVAEAVVTFSRGAVASISASRIGQRKIRSISIAELDRTTEIDLLRRDVTVYRHVSHEQQPLGGYRQQTIIEIPELVTAQEPLAAQLNRFLDVVGGKVDMALERDSILPAHRVVSEIMDCVDAA